MNVTKPENGIETAAKQSILTKLAMDVEDLIRCELASSGDRLRWGRIKKLCSYAESIERLFAVRMADFNDPNDLTDRDDVTYGGEVGLMMQGGPRQPHHVGFGVPTNGVEGVMQHLAPTFEAMTRQSTQRATVDTSQNLLNLVELRQALTEQGLGVEDVDRKIVAERARVTAVGNSPVAPNLEVSPSPNLGTPPAPNLVTELPPPPQPQETTHGPHLADS